MIKKRTKTLLIQITEYMVAGGAWFWSGYIIIVLLSSHIGLFWANAIGNAVGITVNFLLNKFWVFKTKRKGSDIANTTWRYVVYTALNAFLLNYCILQLLKNIGIPVAIGQFIAAGFFTVWNFFWYKYWVFKGKPSPKRIKHHA